MLWFTYIASEMPGTLGLDSANFRGNFPRASVEIYKNNSNKISTRRAAVKNRFCGDFIRRELLDL